jgi:Holliday junction resolvasome RuvABC endonuclease subunit
MPTKHPNILAIDPGTKEIGVAVLTGLELRYFGVKTIRRRQSPQTVLGEAARHITALINEYEPESLAIEKTFLIQKNAALLNVVAAEIKHTARRRGLTIYEYAPTEVRKFICQSGKATKRETAQRICERYPELARYLTRPTKWEEMYWANMFDAVAVGVTCLHEISQAALKANDSQQAAGITSSDL